MVQAVCKFENLDRENLFREIIESLKILPDPLRQVFVRSHYQGRSNAQIAMELGLPEDTVFSMLEDANLSFHHHLHDLRRIHG